MAGSPLSASDARPSSHRGLRVLGWTAAVAAFVVASLVVTAVVTANTDWARRKVQSIASRKLDRDVRIGALHVDWRLPLRVRVNDLRISNASWASQAAMAQVREAEVEIRVLPLVFVRGLVLPSVSLREPRIVLERDGDRNNWTFGPRSQQASSERTIPRIDRMSIDNGELQYLEPRRRTDLKVGARPEGDGMALRVAGHFGGEPVQLQARTGGIGGLFGEQPYPVDAEGRIGGTRLRAQGSIDDPRKFDRLQLQLEVAGESASDIGKPFGIAVPDTPPYRIAGKLSKRGEVWRYDDFKGRLGDSDLAGFLQYDPRASKSASKDSRPLLTASLSSDRLDFNDLGPLIGAPPGTGPGQTASARQRRLAAERRARGEVLPDTKFESKKWRLLDAKVDFLARRVVNAPGVPITRLQGTLDLNDGAVVLKPLKVAVAGGNVDGEVNLDGRKQPLAGSIDVDLAGLRIERLVPKVQKLRSSFGPLYGQIRLSAQGESVKALLGTADGDIRMALAGGRISNLLIEAVGLDAGEALKFLARGDKQVDLRCAALAFDVRDGLARTQALVLDTADSTIYGDGDISFADETLGLTFQVKPKDRSILSLRTPLHVRGTFRQPRIAPEAGNLAVRGIAMLAMAAVNPLLALLPTIETGPGRNSDCARVLGQTPAWAEQAALQSADKAAAPRGPDKAVNAQQANDERYNPRAGNQNPPSSTSPAATVDRSSPGNDARSSTTAGGNATGGSTRPSAAAAPASTN